MSARERLRFPAALLLLVLGGSGAAAGSGEVETWPHELRQGDEVLTVYQPQVESWNGLRLEGQAAVSLRRDAPGAATFGVIWFSARTIVEKSARLVWLEDLTLTRVSFPSSPERAEEHAATLRARLAGAPRVIALDRLEADLALASAGRQAEREPARNDPPRILFSSVPALLVNVAGEPVYRPVPDTRLDRVVNTRPLLLRDAAGRQLLRVLDGWMVATRLEGPWSRLPGTTPELEEARRQAVASGSADLLEGAASGEGPQPASPRPAPMPVIHVATEPTELIVTEGEPSWAPIGGGTRLLYVRNTSGHVFRHLGDQGTYVLLSGRWFRATAEDGPWSFVPQDALPADFARIPDDSPAENVKASVTGTPQAEEALIADRIPQTARVDARRTAMTPPEYDGTPQLRPIEGTSLQYVVNSATPIIAVAPGSYYALQHGVWFTASFLSGPWRVALQVPAAVYAIPPSSPVHYVTYVRVYEATPDVVIVGYTPGYTGSYVSGGVVVWGTGYRYASWVGTVWLSAPVTYGYGVSVAYTPWTGWAYAAGFGWSAWAPYPYYAPAYWGAAAVGPYGAAAVGPYGAAAVGRYGSFGATTGNVYSRWGSTEVVSRTSGGYDAWTGNAFGRQTATAYNSRTGVAAAGERAGVQNAATGDWAAGERGVVQGPGGATAAGGRVSAGDGATGRSVSAGRGAVYDPVTGSAGMAAGVRGADGGAVGRVGGDLYAGKDGNVYRRGSEGWQQYQNGAWSAVGDPARVQSLEQRRAARGTGESRVQRFRQGDRGGSGRSRPATGSRPARRQQ